ncbi:MAG: ADP-ribosylglycohydrolase family protein [Treponema sp.]|jgi:ADP-ribosylglycohydrolase|nr:ADP-ribosylglycohydrolase family protein [Treponema sp.]
MAWLTLAEKAAIDYAMMTEISIKEQVFGAFYGGITGDALGVPFEFKNRGTFTAQGMEGFGTYMQRPGTWSDDSALTLCMVENFTKNGDEAALMGNIARYAEEAYWTPRGKVFDIGGTTRAAIDRFRAGIPPNQCGLSGETDNGNGALMRIAPAVLPFMFVRDAGFAALAETAVRYAGLTHAHPRSTLGCIIYVYLLYRLSQYDTFEKALEKTIQACESGLKDTVYAAEMKHYSRVFNREIPRLKVEEVYSDGYVVHTLEAALWCVAKNGNYKDTVLAAVNLGGDTDTTAAVAGTIAGLLYKYKTIPAEWIAVLARKEDIDALLGKAVEIILENYMARVKQAEQKRKEA